MPKTGICRALLQGRRLWNASLESWSLYQQRALLGCLSSSTELTRSGSLAQTLHGPPWHSAFSVDQDRQKQKTSQKIHMREDRCHQNSSSALTEADTCQHISTEPRGLVNQQSSHTLPHALPRGMHPRTYSTADVIKKLRIPSKQLPNPDEARRLAHMHEWRVSSVPHPSSKASSLAMP